MFSKLALALVLVAICLSLVSGADASPKSFGGGPGGVSGTDLGSGR